MRICRSSLSRVAAATTVAVMMLASGATPAAIIKLQYVFEAPAWTGDFSYDDTTGIPLSGALVGFTTYDVVDLNVTLTLFRGSPLEIVQTFSLSDHTSPLGLEFKATIDPQGIWQTAGIGVTPLNWAFADFVNSEGWTHRFNSAVLCSSSSCTWGEPTVSYAEPGGQIQALSPYLTTPAPAAASEPPVLTLLGLALLGLAAARVKHSKHRFC